MSIKHSRKDFLKRMGLTLTGVTASAASFAGNNSDDELIDEQKEFLKDYELWLREFQGYIKKRNINPQDSENNKHLMELSSASEQRRKTLEMYMKDPKFAAYFNQITKEITKAI